MNSKSIETAFQRRPRPQFPTATALLEKARKDTDTPFKSRPMVSTGPVLRHETPWESMKCLGELVQGEQTWSLCVQKNRLSMVEKIDLKTGREELEKIKLLDHPNIATLQAAYDDDSFLYLQYDYRRYTLEEMLNVHVRFDECYIRIIATSVCPCLTINVWIRLTKSHH